MFDTISSSFAHIKAGKLRALSVTSVTRSDCQIPHTEISSYLRNLAVPRGF